MRAITKNTRRVTALTLAAALVVAVYLNWQYARTGIGVDEEAVNVSAVAVEGEPVAAPVTDGLMTEAEAVSSANKNYGEAQLVSVANDAGAKFFEEARLKRQKAHDEAMDTIQKSRPVEPEEVMYWNSVQLAITRPKKMSTSGGVMEPHERPRPSR